MKKERPKKRILLILGKFLYLIFCVTFSLVLYSRRSTYLGIEEVVVYSWYENTLASKKEADSWTHLIFERGLNKKKTDQVIEINQTSSQTNLQQRVIAEIVAARETQRRSNRSIQLPNSVTIENEIKKQLVKSRELCVFYLRRVMKIWPLRSTE